MGSKQKRRLTDRIGWAALAALVLTSPSTAGANAWHAIGYDADSIGKGGALTGGAEGPAATFYNPAGIIKNRRDRRALTYIHGRSLLNVNPDNNPDMLDFEGFTLRSDSQIDSACGTLDENSSCVKDYRRYNDYLVRAVGRGVDGGGIRGAYEELNGRLIDRAENPKPVNGITFGMSRPITEIEGLKLPPAAMGVSVFLPVDPWPYVVHQRVKGPTTPFFLRYDDLPHRVLVALGGAVEIAEGLRLGLVLDLAADVEARVDATALLPAELRFGSILTPDPNLTDITIVPEGAIHVPLTLTPVVGAQYSPNKYWDFGLRYREEQQVDVDARANLILSSPFSTNEIPARLRTQARFVPREVAGGFAWNVLRKVTLFADVTWRQWSRFRPVYAIEGSLSGPGAAAAACDIVRTFSDLDSILELAQEVVGVGADEICNLADEQLGEEFELTVWDRAENGFEDTINPAVGVSLGEEVWQVSSGYRFEPSPVPPQTGVFNILAADTHTLSGAFEVALFDWVRFGAFAQYQLLKSTRVSKDRATVEEQSADADAFPDADDDPSAGPDAGFQTSDPTLDRFADYVDGTQILNPGYPGYVVNGGYLSGGLQITVVLD